MKNLLRKEALFARKNLTKDFIEQNSDIIINKLLSLKEYKTAKSILCYSSYNNEVDTTKLINIILSDNKKLYLPKCNVKNKEFNVCPVKSIDELKSGAYGILEPKDDYFLKDDIDLAIVPMVAFDKNKGRIGYGAGYYDKYFSKNNPKKIGLAFSVQEVENVNASSHDIPIDIIITETDIL